MTLLGARHFSLRHAIALAPLIAPLAGFDRAEAACDATSPVNNTVVTCTGTTTDANGTTGFGDRFDNGNTYNIVSGASVTGTFDGLAFGRGTVNNSGTISGERLRHLRQQQAVVNNSGTISANGFHGNGVGAFSYHITNSGRIEANGDGGNAVGSGSSVNDLTNTGTISANGLDGIGVQSNGLVNANNSGNITASGVNGRAVSVGGLNMFNSGFIGATKIGIEGDAFTNVTNASGGTIAAVGPGGIGIFGSNSAKIDNAGQILAAAASGVRSQNQQCRRSDQQGHRRHLGRSNWRPCRHHRHCE